MAQQQMGDVLRLACALYDQQRQALSALQAEEARLRSEIARVRAMGSGRGPALSEMRSVGADLLWKGWQARAISTLNMELARVLAKKMHEQARVRKAFGRKTALEEIIAQSERDRRKLAAERALDAAIAGGLQRPGGTGWGAGGSEGQ